MERSRLITGEGIVAGDIVIGLPSVGLHTNGYSLARKIAFEAERSNRGHADRFWSVVLACQTERGPMRGGTADIGALVVG